MALTKPTGAWTYEDLVSLPDDGRRYEIIDGELFELPSPTSAHALVIMALVRMLLPLLDALRGDVLVAPLDVFFGGANPVQPDLVIVLPEGPARIVTRGVAGAPDLLIEVLSPSNRPHDREIKRALYAAGGVREYWLVDPEARTLEILQLSGNRYQQASFSSGEGMATSPVLGQLPIPMQELFARIDA